MGITPGLWGAVLPRAGALGVGHSLRALHVALVGGCGETGAAVGRRAV